jgi:ATP-dependent Clp protease ATP-binding subunit ClpB
LQRLITTDVETPLARKLIAGEIVPESTVTVGAKDGKLTFEDSATAPNPA